jgi:hypothetical protein
MNPAESLNREEFGVGGRSDPRRQATDRVMLLGRRLLDLMLDRGDMEGRQVWCGLGRDCVVAGGADRADPLGSMFVRSPSRRC